VHVNGVYTSCEKKPTCDVTACGKSPRRWYIQRAPNKHTKRASDELSAAVAERERNVGGGGEGLTSTRIRACGHAGWTTGASSAEANLHHHRTHSPLHTISHGCHLRRPA